MQTGKLRRTVCKLQQLRDDFYAFPKTDIKLWMIQRTDGSQGKLPPGLDSVYRLFTVLTLTCEYYVTIPFVFTASGFLDENQGKPYEAFCPLIARSDYLLKEANLTPKYDHDATLYAVAKMAINGDISTSTPHCWQGGSLFAKSMVDGMRLPIACSDWFVTVDELPEAIGDTLDELLNRLEQSTVVEPSDSPVSSEEKQLPSKPEQPQPKRYRKKPAVPAERKQQEIAFGFLLLWHQYGNENFNNDPIPTKQDWQQWMKDRSSDKPVPNPVAVTRMMKAMFGGMKEYNQHCQARTIHRELAKAVLESAKVPQSKLPKEHITEDPEIDLD